MKQRERERESNRLERGREDETVEERKEETRERLDGVSEPSPDELIQGQRENKNETRRTKQVNTH